MGELGAGFPEVAVNFGKTSINNPDKQALHSNIKKLKRQNSTSSPVSQEEKILP